MIIVFQVYHNLLIFGKASLPIALLVLLTNAAFVVGFSINQMRNICVPAMSLIDCDLPDFAYQLAYRDSGNIFLCTTGFNTLVSSGKCSGENCNFGWTPCTLRGLSSQEYDLMNLICPVAYNGCYQHPSCLKKSNNDSTSRDVSDPGHANLVDICSDGSGEEMFCQGVVSATYYFCPNAGTVIDDLYRLP
jgi:hypothetical protein